MENKNSAPRSSKHPSGGFEDFDVIFNAVADLVSIHDRDFRIVKVNKALAEALGMRPEELAGKKCFETIHGTEGARPECPHRRVLESGKAQTEEIWEPRLQRHLQISVSPIYDEKGRPVGSIHIARDITRQKRAETEHLESQGRFHQLAEQNRSISWEIDAEGLFTYVSRVAEPVLGYRPEELVGRKHFYDLFPEDRCEAIKERAFAVFERQDPFSGLENPVLAKDGRVFWVSVSGLPMTGAGGKKPGYRGSITDITERRRAEEDLKKSEERARRLAAENEFVAEIGRIVTSAAEIEDVYEQFAEEANKFIRFDRVAVTLLDPDQKSFFIPYVSGTAVPEYRRGTHLPLSRSFLEKLMGSRQGVLLQAKKGEEEAGKEIFEQEYPVFLPNSRVGLQSAMMVPLLVQDRVIGSLNFHSAQAEAFSENDLRLGRRIGNQIAGAIANAQLFQKQKSTEAALLASEKHYRTLVEAAGQAGEGVIITQNEGGREGVITFANDSALDITGFSLEEILNKSWFDLLHPEDRPHAVARYKRRIKGERISGIYELTITGRNGAPLSIEATAVGTDFQKKPAVITFLRDITERRRAAEALKKSEEEARKLAMENETMAAIGRIVSSTLNMDEVCKAFSQEVKKLLPYDRIIINLLNEDHETVTDRYLEGDPVPGRNAGDAFPKTGSLTEEVVEKRRGIIIDIRDENEIAARYPGLLPEMKAGYRSFLSVPLISGNQPIGSFHLRSRQYGFYSEKDLKRALSIANQIAGAIAIAVLFENEKRMEEELLKSQERYRRIVENVPLGILTMDSQGNIVDMNLQVLSILGSPSAEATRNINLLTFPPLVEAGISAEYRRCLEAGESASHETSYRTRWGKQIYLRYHLVPIRSPEGEITGVQSLLADISEQRRLQGQLQQSQKMEAIGTLAGGIAHDFNNILAAILGYAELAGLDIPEESKARHNLQQSIKAAHRAKDLVSQILAFSRQGKQERKPLDIRPIIKEALKFLRASLPATIEIRQELAVDLGTIEGEPTQVYQVLMNLCTNAAHAMADRGGVLSVSLDNADVGMGSSASPDLDPGPYLRLRVRDTGHGMPPEIMKKIFDPYFTTKEVGKGTGLGLAVVHGIVKTYGGGIAVSSEAGRGSVFEIYFPRVAGSSPAPGSETSEPIPRGEHERVLFVDDEQAIAEVGKGILAHLGYEAEVRTSSVEALELFKAAPDRFDLVITDMTMPNLTGDKLAQEILGMRPGIPIILCTGFSENISAERAKSLGIREFVMKPLIMKDLALAVRRALDSRKKMNP